MTFLVPLHLFTSSACCVFLFSKQSKGQVVKIPQCEKKSISNMIFMYLFGIYYKRNSNFSLLWTVNFIYIDYCCVWGDFFCAVGRGIFFIIIIIYSNLKTTGFVLQSCSHSCGCSGNGVRVRLKNLVMLWIKWFGSLLKQWGVPHQYFFKQPCSLDV